MAHSRRLVILLFFFLAAFTVLFGAEKEEGAQITALWLDGRRPAGEFYVRTAKGTPQKLAIGVSGRGSPLNVSSAGGAVVILRKVASQNVQANPAANGTDGFEPAGEILWPAGGARKVLLILGASGNAPSGVVSVRGMAVADDFTVFPLGSVRVANFIGTELVGRIGDRVQSVPAGVSFVAPYPVQPKPGSKAIANFPLALARTAEGGPVDLIFNSRVDAWPFSRTLLLVYPGATAQSDPVVRTILQVLPPPPPLAGVAK